MTASAGYIVLAGRSVVCYTTELTIGQRMADLHRNHRELYDHLATNAHPGMIPFLTTLENAPVIASPMHWRVEMNGWSGPKPLSPADPFYRIEKVDWGLNSPRPIPARSQ